jgi:putative transcriptional regulator
VKNVVRELRMTRGMSQGDLGAALRVSRQTINAIENGRYLPSLPLALCLGRFFSMALEEMFQLEDEDGES